MKRKIKAITQLETIKSVRKAMPRPTIRYRLRNRESKSLNTKQILYSYFDEIEDEYFGEDD